LHGYRISIQERTGRTGAPAQMPPPDMISVARHRANLN
jgi:hypothetical protein